MQKTEARDRWHVFLLHKPAPVVSAPFGSTSQPAIVVSNIKNWLNCVATFAMNDEELLSCFADSKNNPNQVFCFDNLYNFPNIILSISFFSV